MNEHDVHLNDTSMSSSDYGEFSHACIHASMAQNDVWLKKYDINSWPRWDYSMQDATLIFSGAGKPDLVF